MADEHGGGTQGHHTQPIIIKKGKKHDHGHHGGAWKVAYADFVTAMMALFIVLWILGQSADVKEKVAEYFKSPISIFKGAGSSVLKGQKNTTVKEEVLDEIMKQEEERKQFEKIGEELKGELASNPSFESLIQSNSVIIEMTEDGMRIELVETNDEVFFESGSANLNAKAEELIHIIGSELGRVNNKIVVEGHTDSSPFNGTDLGYTNWELSADRANAARRVLLVGGLRKEQVSQVIGYADKNLRNKQNPADKSNRRVSVLVKYSEVRK